MTNCKKCGDPLANTRLQFCPGGHCRYWFNLIKKHNERHLPPAKKRTPAFFLMCTGAQYNSLRGHGRKPGGIIRGGMAARVLIMTEAVAPVNYENLYRHFFGNSFNLVKAKRGDGTYLSKDEFLQFKNYSHVQFAH